MRILFVHNDYAKFSGEEAAAEGIAKLLENKGHDVIWLRKTSAVIRDSLRQRASAFASGIYSFAARAEMAELLKNSNCDLVQVQNLYPFLSPSILLTCRDFGMPVVMRCPNYRLFCPTGLHLRDGQVCESCLAGMREIACIRHNCAGDVSKSIGYAMRNAFARLTRMIVDNVSCFVVLSEFQRQKFIDNGIQAEQIAVLPNAVPAVSGTSTPPADGLVTFVGRLSPEKGIGEFFEAARRLPHIQFAAAGDVSPELEQLVAARPPNVHMTGFLSGASLNKLFDSSRLIVCPSKCYEGFPNVIGKAMAHARPVVASRIGSIAEIVDEQATGLLFTPGKPDEFAECIAKLWADLAVCRRMGEAGLRKARTEYAESTVADQLMRIYRQALGRRTGIDHMPAARIR